MLCRASPGAGKSRELLLRKAAPPALPMSTRQHGTARKTLGFLVQGAEPSKSRNAPKPERLLLGCERNVTSRALLFRRNYAITITNCRLKPWVNIPASCRHCIFKTKTAKCCICSSFPSPPPPSLLISGIRTGDFSVFTLFLFLHCC